MFVDNFNARNKCLTAKLLKQGYRYHKLKKDFYKFYRRHVELVQKYNVGLQLLFTSRPIGTRFLWNSKGLWVGLTLMISSKK